MRFLEKIKVAAGLSTILVSVVACADSSLQAVAPAAVEAPEIDTAVLPFVVVSDIDDTIKISHVSSIPNLVGRTFFKKQIFSGMPELYTELARSSQMPAEKALYFISSSPNFLHDSLAELLDRTAFPARTLLLRDWMEQADSFIFKNATIAQLGKDVEQSFVMLGDDTEKDPEVYDRFRSEHKQDKSLAIYIRRVTGASRKIPQGIKEFYTAMDVALMEHQRGRLSESQVVSVANAILAASDELIIPEFADCLSDAWIAQLLESVGNSIPMGSDLFNSTDQVYKKIRQICRKHENLV